MALDNPLLSTPTQTRWRRTAQASLFTVIYCVALIAFLFAILAQASDAIGEYPVVFFLCFLIGVLSIYGQLLSIQRGAAIHFASFVFCYLFMSIAPMVQMGAYSDPIFRIEHWAFWAAVNALAFASIGVFVTYRMRMPDDRTSSKPMVVPSLQNYCLVFLITAVTAAVAIFLFRDVLFSSRDEYSDAGQNLFGDQIVSVTARMFLSSVPFIGGIIGLRSAIAGRQNLWIVLFSLVLLAAAILNSPIINPRYQVAGLVIFAVDYLFYGKKTKLVAAMLVAGVLLAPILQVFRHADGTIATEGEGLLGKTFLSMDYDSFLTSSYTMMTVNDSGISWGSNFVGAALFFVPRTLWEAKPEPTSWVIYETMDRSRVIGTANLSTPLMAEGYYAFGWAGALLISILYWWGISWVTLRSRKDIDSWAFLSRGLFAGLALVFLRGTLTVGVSAAAGLLVAAAIPMFLLRYRSRATRRF